MLIQPIGPAVTGNGSGNKNDVSQSKAVLVVNGDQHKVAIFITNQAGTVIASFAMPRYSMVKIKKNPLEKLYAQDALTGGGGNANVTFTPIGFTD